MEAMQTNLAKLAGSLTTQDLSMLGLSSFIWTSIFIGVTLMPIPLKNKYAPLSQKNEFDI